MINEKIFVADNFRLAMAMTACGFSLRSVEKTVDLNNKERTVCEFEPSHNGIDANYLKACFENYKDEHGIWHGIYLAERINEIVATRGITQEEYVLIAFDAARAALSNRDIVMSCIKFNKPLIARDLKDGRYVIFRQGTAREQIESLIKDS